MVNIVHHARHTFSELYQIDFALHGRGVYIKQKEVISDIRLCAWQMLLVQSGVVFTHDSCF
jgi:hypothetical protein